MHTEYALARYHDGTGEKAEGWHIQTSAISEDYQTAFRHLKCAQARVLSKQRIGLCLDQKELKIMGRWVTDWNAEGRPVVVAGPGYIRKEDLPTPDLQASVGMEQARQDRESTSDSLHRQEQARNAAVQQATGDACPHCGGKVRRVTTHRGRSIPVCDRCGYLVHSRTACSDDRHDSRTACSGDRHGSAGLLYFVATIAAVCLVSCVVCTAMACKAMNDARQIETKQER